GTCRPRRRVRRARSTPAPRARPEGRFRGTSTSSSSGRTYPAEPKLRLVAPARRALLEEGAEAFLALVARAALGDPARCLRPVRPLAHEPLRPARRLRACR